MAPTKAGYQSSKRGPNFARVRAIVRCSKEFRLMSPAGYREWLSIGPIRGVEGWKSRSLRGTKSLPIERRIEPEKCPAKIRHRSLICTFPVLHSGAPPLAEESSESRIRRIRTDRWGTYRRAGSRAAMEDLLTFLKCTCMPNLLLAGPTNSGKTMIVEKFRRSHPPGAARSTEDGAAGR